MRHNPRPQEMYRHFKGNLYQIRSLAKHSETGELMVVYQAMYDAFEIYVRPLALFMDEVDRAKYPEARQRYRFELLEDVSSDGDEEAFRAPRVAVDQEKALPRSDSVWPAAEDEAQKAQERKESQEPRKAQDTAEADEQLNIDPLVLEFLDAGFYERRLMILDSLHSRITDDMINTMAVSVDLEIKDGALEDRYTELRNCLRTFEKYECNRLR